MNHGEGGNRKNGWLLILPVLGLQMVSPRTSRLSLICTSDPSTANRSPPSMFLLARCLLMWKVARGKSRCEMRDGARVSDWLAASMRSRLRTAVWAVKLCTVASLILYTAVFE